VIGWGRVEGECNHQDTMARLDRMVASLSEGFENLKQLLENM
jgi:hypothetical protein